MSQDAQKETEKIESTMENADADNVVATTATEEVPKAPEKDSLSKITEQIELLQKNMESLINLNKAKETKEKKKATAARKVRKIKVEETPPLRLKPLTYPDQNKRNRTSMTPEQYFAYENMPTFMRQEDYEDTPIFTRPIPRSRIPIRHILR